MTEATYSGPLPDQIDIRIQRRDQRPLPAGALLEFQAINRGKSPRTNYRWLLFDDGTWFLAKHSGRDTDWQIPFDTKFPETAAKKLPPAVVQEVQARLQEADFLNLPPYHVNETVEDGRTYVVTGRVAGQTHEVIFEAITPPLVEYLAEIVHDYQ